MRFMIFLLCAFFQLKAQDSVNYSVNYLRVAELLSPVSQSANAASLYFLPRVEYGTLSLDISHQKGAFKPIMSAKESSGVGLFTEKYRFFKNTVLYGSFSGNKRWDKNVNYSNVNNPYRVTPYLMLDTVGNDENDREFYQLKGAIASAFGKSVFGASLNYQVGLMAQNRDPRAKNLVTQLQVKPGYFLQLKNINIGFNVGYSYFSEDIQVKNIEQNRLDNMYYLLGLRSAITLRDNSFLRLYKRNGYNAEVQFSNQWLTFFAGGEMSNETADDGEYGWSVQRNFARLKQKNFYVNGIFTFSPKNNLHQLKSFAKLDACKGTEIIQKKESIPPFDIVDWVTIAENDSYTKQQLQISLDYTITRMQTAFTRNYVIGFEADYAKELEEYLVFKDKKELSNLEISTYFIKQFICKSAMLSFKPILSYNLNLESSLSITDFSQTPDIVLPPYYTVIENRLVRPDFTYFTTNYFSPELRITYEKALRNSKNKFFVKGNFKWILPEDNWKGYRQLLTGIVGITL